MATEITEKLIVQSDKQIDDKTKEALSYYEKANNIIKRTHFAMGRFTLCQTTTTIASTIDGQIVCNNHAKTH